MKITTLLTAGFIGASLATASFAAEDGDEPKPTKTTKECKKGKVWDDKKNRCVKAKHSMFDDDFLYDNAREFAYAGQYDNAIELLTLAADQSDPRILTYYGFAHRKAGRTAQGMAFYAQALATDPDYNLARSYMGQALMLQGDKAGAENQLAEIVSRGGKDTYAYLELQKALTGRYTY